MLLVLAMLCFDERGDESAPTATWPADLATDRYGGLLAIKSEATGFFRVEERPDLAGRRRWMFITPEGHGYLALGANHIGKYLDRQAADLGLLDRLGNGQAPASRRQAVDFLLAQLRAQHYNAGEAYAPLDEQLQRELPWVANLRFPFRNKFAFDVFDPAVQEKLDRSIRTQCQPLAANPLVIGLAFSDLPEWGERRLAFYDELPAEAPGAIVRARFRDEGRGDDEFLAEVARVLYEQLRTSTRAAAPNHLLFGERFRLRGTPEAVVKAVGPHVDVFCTQALILSPQRPPEWQTFQPERYRTEHAWSGRPLVVIDWAAPFSTGETFATERGEIRDEATAAGEAADWLVDALSEPSIVGVFQCQFIGLHGNDAWFDGQARRTSLQDDGRPFPVRTATMTAARLRALRAGYGLLP